MDLVIDANILFAVLIKEGKTENLIFSDALHLFAPEFIFEEFDKYRDYILGKTKRSKGDFEKFLEIIKKRIQIIPNEETEHIMQLAKDICPDPGDADYFAVALKFNCPIWSNEKKLTEQCFVKIYTTKELVDKFGV